MSSSPSQNSTDFFLPSQTLTRAHIIKHFIKVIYFTSAYPCKIYVARIVELHTKNVFHGSVHVLKVWKNCTLLQMCKVLLSFVVISFVMQYCLFSLNWTDVKRNDYVLFIRDYLCLTSLLSKRVPDLVAWKQTYISCFFETQRFLTISFLLIFFFGVCQNIVIASNDVIMIMHIQKEL